MAGRPDSGSISIPIVKVATQVAADTGIFQVDTTGAESVTFFIKVATGTPTVTIGAFTHQKSARDTTLANNNLMSVTTGATLVAGQSITVATLTTNFTTARGALNMPAAQLDIQVAGACTGLEIVAVVRY